MCDRVGCLTLFDCDSSRVGHAKKIGAPLYCCKACAGLARRTHKTDDEKRAEKSAYDRARLNGPLRQAILDEKRAYYKANVEAIQPKQAAYRAAHMHRHVEYCRQPEYRAKKHEYDTKRNEADYGEFAEAWRLLLDLEKEIRSQATSYERRVANGYYLRSAQNRRREAWRQRKSSNSMQAT